MQRRKTREGRGSKNKKEEEEEEEEGEKREGGETGVANPFISIYSMPLYKHCSHLSMFLCGVFFPPMFFRK